MSTENKYSLAGRTILITGASSGIGRAACQLLSARGARLLLVARNPERLEATLTSLPAGNHRIYPFDLTALEEIPSFLKRITAETEPISGIFHSAGVESILPIPLLKPAGIETALKLTVEAALMLTRGYCQMGVGKNGGALVFMSSVAGQRGVAGLSVYSASRGAVDAAVRSLAAELAPRKIRVNSIAAGAVKTEMHERITGKQSPEALKVYEAAHPLGFGTAEDVAETAAFLLAETGAWITGTTLVVDGGYCCK